MKTKIETALKWMAALSMAILVAVTFTATQMPNVQAQQVVGGVLNYQPKKLVDSGTNQILLNTTNAFKFGTLGAPAAGPIARIDARNGKEIGLVFEFKQTAAGTTNNFGFVFRKGITYGATTNYADDNQIIWVPGNSTSLRRFATNVTVNGISDYYLVQIWNTNEVPGMTNIAVYANVK